MILIVYWLVKSWNLPHPSGWAAVLARSTKGPHCKCLYISTFTLNSLCSTIQPQNILCPTVCCERQPQKKSLSVQNGLLQAAPALNWVQWQSLHWGSFMDFLQCWTIRCYLPDALHSYRGLPSTLYHLDLPRLAELTAEISKMIMIIMNHRWALPTNYTR